MNVIFCDFDDVEWLPVLKKFPKLEILIMCILLIELNLQMSLKVF